MLLQLLAVQENNSKVIKHNQAEKKYYKIIKKLKEM